MDVSVLLGQTLTSIFGCEAGSDEIRFHTKDGRSFRMFHSQECCECVTVDDVVGDVDDLVDSPLLMAEESTNEDEPTEKRRDDGSHTWTFYRFATLRGYVTIKWYGTSNGYYSERVYFEEIK